MKNCKVQLDFDELEEIGQEGRNSKVFLAHDNQLDGKIVIKEIPKREEVPYNEYFKEARLLYANNHNNIVKVNYACEDIEKIYIAMPYYKNGSLKKKISNENYLTVREVIRYAIQFLSGLNHIHSRGLIHYDIKPDNIMISDTNEALLADFGLAKYTNSDGFADQDFFYTLHASPEMLIQDMLQTIKSDIYQAGITIYRMANGNDFFYKQKPENSVEFSQKVLNGTFPNRNFYLPHIPKKLRKIIAKCISPSPNDRYNNTLEIINELSLINQNLDIKHYTSKGYSSWIIPKEKSNYDVNLIPNKDKFDIKVYKNKDGKTTNLPSKCSNNLEYVKAILTLNSIFASL